VFQSFETTLLYPLDFNACLIIKQVPIKLLPRSSVKAVDEFVRLFSSVNFTAVPLDLSVEDLEYESEEIFNAA